MAAVSRQTPAPFFTSVVDAEVSGSPTSNAKVLAAVLLPASVTVLLWLLVAKITAPVLLKVTGPLPEASIVAPVLPVRSTARLLSRACVAPTYCRVALLAKVMPWMVRFLTLSVRYSGQAIERLRRLRRALPAGFTFDREEVHER